jgi:hypothetical protein
MGKITVDLPDEMLNKLQSQNQTLQTILMEVINEYLERKTLKHASNTRKLCGNFEVIADQKEKSKSTNHQKITNYAENLDQDLY